MPADGRLTGDARACDVLVVGGGINGVGIARDLAGRGVSVVLCERDDLASHTSSASTKLVHGGLRYLEHGAFRLVRKALVEREVLLASAPHIAWPLRFVVPHEPSLRPAWLVRLGLLIYDHLAPSRTLPRSTTIDLRDHVAGRPLRGERRRAFCYADGWIDDARLVVLNAVDARERGARVATRTACVDAARSGDRWTVRLRTADGQASTLRARALVNATGPWAARFLRDAAHAAPRRLRLVRGSHIVVAKRFDHPFAYLFQNADRRVVFAIPYERDFTLIGTTDVEVEDPGDALPDDAEIDYLCAEASRWFDRPVTPADVLWRYAGVRPLVDDAAATAAAVTRDYALDLDAAGAPLLTVRGGKLTTYRRLAEEAADRLCAALGHDGRAWTAQARLPGGEFRRDDETPVAAFARFFATLRSERPWLPERLAGRLARAYGTRTSVLLGDATSLADLGPEVAPDLHAAELRYLVAHEWARTADDVLWRRTKLGLHVDGQAAARVAAWLERARA